MCESNFGKIYKMLESYDIDLIKLKNILTNTRKQREIFIKI